MLKNQNQDEAAFKMLGKASTALRSLHQVVEHKNRHVSIRAKLKVCRALVLNLITNIGNVMNHDYLR